MKIFGFEIKISVKRIRPRYRILFEEKLWINKPRGFFTFQTDNMDIESFWRISEEYAEKYVRGNRGYGEDSEFSKILLITKL